MAQALGGSHLSSIVTPLPESREALQHRKLLWAREAPGRSLPTNAELLATLSEEPRVTAEPRLRLKPSRSQSGVAVVAVMTSPAACPHGTCRYCPGGVAQRSPQSYTGEEPSALRGAQFGFDARAITEHRIRALRDTGHPASKVEVIVMGGTFPSRPWGYQESVFRGIFNGLNGSDAPSLAEAISRNETATHRCVGLTVETRPDWCDSRVLPRLLASGVTRVELGVECLDDSVLRAVGRAHGVDAVVEATREARDRGLKIVYHMMPGLPGMDPDRDLATFSRLFDDARFRPDMLKIYPTLVLPGTPLYDDWREGRYTPYDTRKATELLVAVKRLLPPWVRIQRIQRDIPSRLIAAGVRTSNLREVVQAELTRQGGRCPCLRCREVGRRALPPLDAFEWMERRYEAAGGTEWFLSLEEPETEAVAAFLRLRFPSRSTSEGLEHPVIRELKVLGTELPVGQAATFDTDFQHRGLGRALLAKAEELAAAQGSRYIYVTSAVGTRRYYTNLGFVPAGSHMAKPLFS